jgi:hypothetical protein
MVKMLLDRNSNFEAVDKVRPTAVAVDCPTLPYPLEIEIEDQHLCPNSLISSYPSLHAMVYDRSFLYRIIA